jgi:hypothetical protein
MSTSSQKAIVILQLCMVFAVLMWIFAGPFMGEYFSIQSSKRFHEAVIGGVDNPDAAAFFNAFPDGRKQIVLTSYHQLQHHIDKGFWLKMGQAFNDLFFHTPSFTLAWMFFSFAVCLLWLFRIDGAATAAWVLPIIAVAYAVDNRLNGVSNLPPDAALFPSEQYLVATYLQKPLSAGVADQGMELTQAWQQYLVTEWALEPASSDPNLFSQQVKKGEHAFTAKRLEVYLAADSQLSIRQPFTVKPLALLMVYISWNLFFAFFISRKP